jgi:multidrug efflux system membrane fusion protein
MMKLHHAKFAAAVFLAGAFLSAPSYADTDLAPVPVKIIHLNPAYNQSQRHYFGTVQGSQRVQLSFRVPGRLIELPVELGKRMKKGDLIGRIDPRDFRTALKEAQSRLSQARAKYTQASSDLKRFEELYKKKVISQSQYDGYKTAYDVARSSVRTAEANVDAAQNALNDTELRAPFNGIVVARMVENFQDVQAKQPVASLQNLDNIEIVVNISEEDIANIAVGSGDDAPFRISDKISIDIEGTIDELPGQTYKLQLKEVGAASSPQTKTYPVTLTMPQPENARILPGMSVSIIAYITDARNEGQQEYFLPLSAVVGDMDQNKWVWRCNKDGAVEKIPVTLGSFRGDRIHVSGALHNGDMIIVDGARGLTEKDTVKIFE